MAYRLEQNEIVIDGWENGIADSPFSGIADIRCANIMGTPGEVASGFKTAAMTIPPTVSAVSFTATAATDLISVSSTTGYYNGMAITLDTTSAGGTSTGRVYWVGDLSGTTFKLYTNPSRNAGTVVNVSSDGSGTLSSYTLAKPIEKAMGTRGGGFGYIYQFILDENGRVWWIDNTGNVPTNNLIYLGNDTITGASGRGIAVYKGYLIVARSSNMDALPTGSIEGAVDLDGSAASGGWNYGFENISSTAINRRPMLVGQDDILYYVNGALGDVGSIAENTGSTFDPTSGSTYTENTSALDLPEGEIITELAELGIDLLVGTITNQIYPWDRVSPSFKYPIILPERYVTRMVSTNQLCYIFAGNRGRIYVTNGTSVDEYKKIPDHVTSKFEPYFTWLDATVHRNQLCFSFTVDENDGTDVTTLKGVWAINIPTGALRQIHTLSTSLADATLMFGNGLTTTPAGFGLFVGWDSSGAYGFDRGSTDPYTGGETIIDTDIIPIGDFTNKETLSDFQFKLSRPLVANESIKILYRTDLSQSFTEIYTTNTAGVISDDSDTNFENAEWLQLRIQITSTATTPSRVRLREIRVTL